MAQTVITGLTGSITLPNNMDQYVSSITLNTGAALLNTSRYGGNGWVSYTPGIKDLSGTAVAFMSKGATGTNPIDLNNTVAEMTITFDSGCYVTFNAILGNISIQGAYEGLNIVTFSFAHGDDAAPTISWVQA